jgi:hypothetical protein
MREIPPAENLSADDFLALAPEWVRDRASQIRIARREGRRIRLSPWLVDKSALLDEERRKGGHPILFLSRERVRKNKTFKNNEF